MSQTVTAYVVKYALTIGIRKVEGAVDAAYPKMLTISERGHLTTHYHGKEWATDAKEAVKLAEERRTKKIKSLEKQIAKLKALDFSEAAKERS